MSEPTEHRSSAEQNVNWKAPETGDSAEAKEFTQEQMLRDTADHFIREVTQAGNGNYKKENELYMAARDALTSQFSKNEDAKLLYEMLPEDLDPMTLKTIILDSYVTSDGKIEPSKARDIYLGAKKKLEKREVTANAIKAQFDISRPLFNKMTEDHWGLLAENIRVRLALVAAEKSGKKYDRDEVVDAAAKRAAMVSDAEQKGQSIPGDEQEELVNAESDRVKADLVKLQPRMNEFRKDYAMFQENEDYSQDVDGYVRGWLEEKGAAPETIEEIMEISKKDELDINPLKTWVRFKRAK